MNSDRVKLRLRKEDFLPENGEKYRKQKLLPDPNCHRKGREEAARYLYRHYPDYEAWANPPLCFSKFF
jgi:hypothetical protein